jgi:hypothetical protein
VDVAKFKILFGPNVTGWAGRAGRERERNGYNYTVLYGCVLLLRVRIINMRFLYCLDELPDSLVYGKYDGLTWRPRQPA